MQADKCLIIFGCWLIFDLLIDQLSVRTERGDARRVLDQAAVGSTQIVFSAPERSLFNALKGKMIFEFSLALLLVVFYRQL